MIINFSSFIYDAVKMFFLIENGTQKGLALFFFLPIHLPLSLSLYVYSGLFFSIKYHNYASLFFWLMFSSPLQ